MDKFINILFPVYNEELRLEKGIRTTIEYMEKLSSGDYYLTIVDNASTDETANIASKLCESYPQVSYIRLEEKGVGAAFRKGIACNTAPIVGYMDVDLSTDINHLEEVISTFRNDAGVGMINGSRWAKKSDTHGRKWYRQLSSTGLTILLKLTLKMRATDAICGFKFFRKGVAEQLVAQAGSDENGWFYIIELLLRAERNDIKIVELPVRWNDDHNSKVEFFKVIQNYCSQIIILRKKFRQEKRNG